MSRNNLQANTDQDINLAANKQSDKNNSESSGMQIANRDNKNAEQVSKKSVTENQNNLDLFDEIRNEDSEKRRNKLHNLLLRSVIVVGAVVTLIAIAIECRTNSIQSISKEQSRDIYSSASIYNREKNLNKFESSLSDVVSTDTAYSMLARFYLAKIALDDNKRLKAIKIYDEIANNENYDASTRFYARMLWLNIQLSSRNYSTQDALSAISRYKLDDLANPYMHSAILLKSILLANDEKYDKSLKEMNRIISSSRVSDDALPIAKNIIQLIAYKKDIAASNINNLQKENSEDYKDANLKNSDKKDEKESNNQKRH